VSMRYSFDDPTAPSTRTTQYFEMFGNRAIYHDGWIASCFHGRLPWVRAQAVPFGETERWELYNIADDFSQGVDLAEQFPDKLAELQTLFDREARAYNVYPLNDETTTRALPDRRPSLLEGQTTTTYFPDHVRVPEMSTINFKNTSFDLAARLHIPVGGASGVVICQGGSMAGWALYLRDGVPSYTYNYLGHDISTISAQQPLPEGPATLALSFDYDGGGLGKGGTATLSVDGDTVATGRIEQTVPFLFSMSGETLDVGVDTGSPVGPYPAEFRFTGTVDRIDVVLRPGGEEHADAVAQGQLRGALGTQ
jgi:hypothetical protein